MKLCWSHLIISWRSSCFLAHCNTLPLISSGDVLLTSWMLILCSTEAVPFEGISVLDARFDDGLVELWDLSLQHWPQVLSQFIVVFLHLLLVLLLIGSDELLVLLNGLSTPQYELFETQAQFVVMTEELGVCWDFIQEDLGHLQWTLRRHTEWEKERKAPLSPPTALVEKMNASSIGGHKVKSTHKGKIMNKSLCEWCHRGARSRGIAALFVCCFSKGHLSQNRSPIHGIWIRS